MGPAPVVVSQHATDQLDHTDTCRNPFMLTALMGRRLAAIFPLSLCCCRSTGLQTKWVLCAAR